MAKARVEMRIDCPPEVAFDYYADIRNELQWNPDARRVEKLTPGDIGPGTQFEADYRGLGAFTMEWVACERPQRLQSLGRNGSMELGSVNTLTPVEGGTLWVAEGYAHPRGLFRLLEPIMGRMIERQFVSTLTRFKRAVEGREKRPAA